MRVTTRPLRTSWATLAAASLAVAPAALADTVVLKSGKKLEDVVVSRHDDELVVLNPWGSRNPGMTWEIPERNFLPAAEVAEVVIADPPRVEYHRRAAARELDAEQHVALARLCAEQRFKQEEEHHWQLALALDPEHPVASEEYARSKWERWAKGNPLARPELRELEAQYVAAADVAAATELWKQMKAAGTARELVYLERARRSKSIQPGRRDQVPLTYGSERASGATYCVYVPRSYDPLVPTPLVVGLHGGGRGGRDDTLVTGSGEAAMPFYQGAAERMGWIVVCPTALAAPWRSAANEPLLRALLDEMALLYNVDETRIYLTGHSMGGFGTWYWGPRMAETWAACAPCAGGGGPNGIASKDLPVYVYHGSDDEIVGPASDRSAARSLASGKRRHDFVYTELDGVGHGFPDSVRDEIFEFFAGRKKDDGKKRAVGPRSSFERDVEKEEVRAFGDPRELEPDAEGGARLKDLIDALSRGGGAGAQAADELAALHDSASVKAVARLLGSKKSSTDTRVLAARALGGMGTKQALSPLTKALGDDDYRVLDAAVVALGRTGEPAAAASLVRASKLVGERYDASFLGGSRMTHTEYVIRLESFAVLADAFATVGDAQAALPALERELVERVYLPDDKPVDTDDPRFRSQPPVARRDLAERLAACLLVLRDPRGVELLESIAANWPDEARLVAACEDGVLKLKEALEAD